MTPLPTPPLSDTETAANKQAAQVVYILYIVGFFVGLTALVGVVLAYAHRSKADPVSRTHFNRQITLFWWGLLWSVLGGALVFAGVGLAVIAAWYIWALVVIINGLSALGRNAPYGSPASPARPA